jgi:hypothetical protein
VSFQTPRVQQHRAAASSARIRSTRRLVREIGNAPALTADQRAQVITAAAQMRLVDDNAREVTGGAA